MLTFNHSSLESRARRLIGHGIERDASKHIWANESFCTTVKRLGYNYRLLKCSTQLSQLSRLDDFLIEREQWRANMIVNCREVMFVAWLVDQSVDTVGIYILFSA